MVETRNGHPRSGARARLGVFGWISALLLLISGLGLAIPGVYLATLDGSLYYALAGLALLGCAVLLALRRPRALTLFGALFLATILWSLVEVGLDFWALMPRLVFFIVAGLWLLITFARSLLATRGERLLVGGTAVLAAVLLVAPLFAPAIEQGSGSVAAERTLAASTTDASDWPSYGNSDSNRYSPLRQITAANVAGLERAWSYHTSDAAAGRRMGSLEVTPLMVDGKVFGCDAFSSIFALDPVTGREIWRSDTMRREMRGGHPVCRGIAFYRASPAATTCPTRLLIATYDNQLVALDAATGARCADFGDDGAADLLLGLGDYPSGWTHPTSPPTIVNGTAVVGAFVVDNQSTDVPPGVIRGYDAETGALKWAFDPARPDSQQPLPPGENYTPSTPNAWTVFSGDPALNLVFVPMGNSSPDFFGAHRTVEDERFSTALVALDATTGAIRWVFQAVHHDLWDYDLSAQPVLVDFPLGGDRVPALILPTKTGQLFVLDRRTGKPIVDVEERPAPAASLPDEHPAPTQPYSVGMPDFSGDVLKERDMWGLTPFDQLYCRILFRQADYRGMYTPAGLWPSLRYPGELGGIDWGSVSVDPGRDLLIVNSNHMADRDQLITRAEAEKIGLVPRLHPGIHSAPGGPMAGTPYAVHWGPFLSPIDVPCQRPPFGYLTAIDLHSRQIVWNQPLGDARNSGPFGVALRLPIRLGAPNIGGTLVTAGGVVFVGATQDEVFRAFDSGSGKLLWQARLPAGGHASPMSYLGPDGKQYVLIAAGGGALRNRRADELIAYRLP